MAVDIKKYSLQLKQLCEDYYFQNISYIEFRIQRNDIFDKIQTEQGMGVGMSLASDGDLCDGDVSDEEYVPMRQD